MSETPTIDLAEAIMQRLAARRADSPFDATSWTSVDELADLAPAGEEPVYAYAHDLDDADRGETRGYDQDATGTDPVWVGARGQAVPIRRRLVPSEAIQETCDRLVAEGRAERHPVYGSYRNLAEEG